jgi:chloramphenicol 3-O-phosphotransferase
MSQVVILSGPSGAGKSSVAESLCERYDRTVHIETDAFFSWIRMGYVHPMRPESDRQNRMVARAVARAASAYAQELYAVFIDGVIGPHLLPIYLEELRPLRVAVQFVVLLPPVDETLRRVAPREADRRLIEEEHRALYGQFAGQGAFAGCVIDNARMTPDQAGDAVMAACGRGDCLVLPAAAG